MHGACSAVSSLCVLIEAFQEERDLCHTQRERRIGFGLTETSAVTAPAFSSLERDRRDLKEIALSKSPVISRSISLY